MTNTTRTLTFRGEEGEAHHTVSTTTPIYRNASGMVLAIAMDGDSFPTIEYTREQLSELVEFGTAVLRATNQGDGVVDAEIMCGAMSENATDCVLVGGHPNTFPEATAYHHIDRRGVRFVEF